MARTANLTKLRPLWNVLQEAMYSINVHEASKSSGSTSTATYINHHAFKTQGKSYIPSFLFLRQSLMYPRLALNSWTSASTTPHSPFSLHFSFTLLFSTSCHFFHDIINRSSPILLPPSSPNITYLVTLPTVSLCPNLSCIRFIFIKILSYTFCFPSHWKKFNDTYKLIINNLS